MSKNIERRPSENSLKARRNSEVFGTNPEEIARQTLRIIEKEEWEELLGREVNVSNPPNYIPYDLIEYALTEYDDRMSSISKSGEQMSIFEHRSRYAKIDPEATEKYRVRPVFMPPLKFGDRKALQDKGIDTFLEDFINEEAPSMHPYEDHSATIKRLPRRWFWEKVIAEEIPMPNLDYNPNGYWLLVEDAPAYSDGSYVRTRFADQLGFGEGRFNSWTKIHSKIQQNQGRILEDLKLTRLARIGLPTAAEAWLLGTRFGWSRSSKPEWSDTEVISYAFQGLGRVVFDGQGLGGMGYFDASDPTINFAFGVGFHPKIKFTKELGSKHTKEQEDLRLQLQEECQIFLGMEVEADPLYSFLTPEVMHRAKNLGFSPVWIPGINFGDTKTISEKGIEQYLEDLSTRECPNVRRLESMDQVEQNLGYDRPRWPNKMFWETVKDGHVDMPNLISPNNPNGYWLLVEDVVKAENYGYKKTNFDKEIGIGNSRFLSYNEISSQIDINKGKILKDLGLTELADIDLPKVEEMWAMDYYLKHGKTEVAEWTKSKYISEKNEIFPLVIGKRTGGGAGNISLAKFDKAYIGDIGFRAVIRFLQ